MRKVGKVGKDDILRTARHRAGISAAARIAALGIALAIVALLVILFSGRDCDSFIVIALMSLAATILVYYGAWSDRELVRRQIIEMKCRMERRLRAMELCQKRGIVPQKDAQKVREGIIQLQEAINAIDECLTWYGAC